MRVLYVSNTSSKDAARIRNQLQGKTETMIIQTQPPAAGEAVALRVLLVEDSRTVRELIIEHLSDIDGIEFSGFAETENDAIAELRNQRFDVVILDIELRQGNGISVLRSLAETPTSQESVKIIFSNNVSNAYRRIGAQYGVHYFLDKTTELPRLHALLAQIRLGAGPR